MCEFIMVACDLHDRTMVLKIARGREAAETVTLRNTSACRRRLIEQLHERARAAGGGRVIFAYEASGQGFGLHDELTAAQIACHVLVPTKIARSTQQRQRKTDEQDAEQILRLLRGHVLAGNPLPTVWIPDAQMRDDRELVRARLDAAEKSVTIKVQIQSLLKRNGLTRPADLNYAWTKKASGWLRMVTCVPALGESNAGHAGQPAAAMGVPARRNRTAGRDLGEAGRPAARQCCGRRPHQDARRRAADGLGVLDRDGGLGPFCQPASNRRLLGPGAAELRERGGGRSQGAHHATRFVARAASVVSGRVGQSPPRRLRIMLPIGVWWNEIPNTKRSRSWRPCGGWA